MTAQAHATKLLPFFALENLQRGELLIGSSHSGKTNGQLGQIVGL